VPISYYNATRLNGDPACARVLFVGEDNPYGRAPEFALHCEPSNCSGERLQRLICGMRPRTYLATWRTNLCVDAWSNRLAVERAELLTLPDVPWRAIVMLGAKVARAFAAATALALRPFEWSPMTIAEPGDAVLVALPHPSGLNRAWNGPEAFARARRLLVERVPGPPWGEHDPRPAPAPVVA